MEGIELLEHILYNVLLEASLKVQHVLFPTFFFQLGPLIIPPEANLQTNVCSIPVSKSNYNGFHIKHEFLMTKGLERLNLLKASEINRSIIKKPFHFFIIIFFNIRRSSIRNTLSSQNVNLSILNIFSTFFFAHVSPGPSFSKIPQWDKRV